MTDKGVELKGGGKGGQKLSVNRDGENIAFRPSWACGEGRRTFTRQGAVELLERIALTAEFDAWYAATDLHGRRYAVKLIDGRLYADEEPRDDLEGGELPSAPDFSWTQFERAVKARTKDLKPEAS